MLRYICLVHHCADLSSDINFQQSCNAENTDVTLESQTRLSWQCTNTVDHDMSQLFGHLQMQKNASKIPGRQTVHFLQKWLLSYPTRRTRIECKIGKKSYLKCKEDCPCKRQALKRPDLLAILQGQVHQVSAHWMPRTIALDVTTKNLWRNVCAGTCRLHNPMYFPKSYT